MDMVLKRIRMLPKGYSEVMYRNRKYGVTRIDFNNGQSHKVYANELGGNNVISLNYYVIDRGENLKPCEMSAQKVIDFLEGYTLEFDS